jgi:signal transduction histidine kinase/ligand-binding sensor domain-containing protein
MQRLRASLLAIVAGSLFPVFALDPGKSLTQYSMAVWTQQQGLPQDSVRAITQTADGHLWLGTDEGLARFDGYEFVTFTKEHSDLPSNSITSLAAGRDGSLWIGTPSGLVHYANQHFHAYTHNDGMAGDSVDSLFEDHTGKIWIVTEQGLSRFDGTKFVNFLCNQDIPVTKARTVVEDSRQNIYLTGWSAVAKLEDGKFTTVVPPATLDKDFPIDFQVDPKGTIWVLGTHELVARSPDGAIHRYTGGELLSGFFALSGTLKLDRNGNLWAGDGGGLARFRTENLEAGGGIERLASLGLVRCIFEDREGDLWVGTSGGLVRLHDDLFTTYGKSEGLPGEEPDAIRVDRGGNVWVGFQDRGLVLFSGKQTAAKQPAGMPHGGVFDIRETPKGDLLVAGRDGLTRLSQNRFQTFVPPDPLGRKSVYGAIEDSAGRTWMATPNGLGVLEGSAFRWITFPESGTYSFLRVVEARDGSVWAGSWKGLLHVKGSHTRLYRMADGLASDHVRSLYSDKDGTIWIGTFGGGLISLRDGKLTTYAVRDGLLSDNVSDIIDDGEALWLSTTRGICRISRSQLKDFAEHRIQRLSPVNYGVAEGLREAQGSTHLTGGGDRHRDGSLWFVTSRGIAVYRPGTRGPIVSPPPVHLVEMVADGRALDWSNIPRIDPGSGRLQIRYSAIHLSAPELIRYSYKLDGLDSDWVVAGSRRNVSYDNLHHGHYRFNIRAELPGAPPVVNSWEFEMLPRFYETIWFRLICALMLAAAGWMVYQLRVQQIRSRFALVLQERARLAREIHDTLTQAFVGIASQLDVVDMRMRRDIDAAHSSLDLARRMAQHSLTEARRSVMDLRAAALDDHDLAAALKSGSLLWAEGSGVEVDVEIKGESGNLPEDVAHHILRIAQEGVTNVLKHARATRVALKLRIEQGMLNLRVRDNGCGFDSHNVFAAAKGHFGLIGMRERAERLGGELRLESRPGEGTELDVTVPLS